MIRHIFKIIWTQRKSNGWIFAELAIVVCAVWWMTDQFYVDMRTYYSPLGHDISNTWRFQLDKLNPNAPNYVPGEEYASTESEDLIRLQTLIRMHPEVANVSISYYSSPYTFSSSFTSIQPVVEDTTNLQRSNFRQRVVSPEYFELFGITDVEGRAIAPMVEGMYKPVVVSREMAEKLFQTADVRGRQIMYPSGTEQMTIAAVTMPYRDHEYKRSEPFFYHVLAGSELKKEIDETGAQYAELCVKMKRPLSPEEMNLFLKEMGDRLTVNNLNVYSVRSINDMRETHLRNNNNELSKKLSLMAFLLVNVFFGIVGTFWLRTQYRLGEMALRMALGARRSDIRGYMYTEGLCLLLLTLPVSAAFAGNMIFMDQVDSYRLPYTAARFLITYGGTYLAMGVMICAGIRFPAGKTGRLAPAETLHYE